MKGRRAVDEENAMLDYLAIFKKLNEKKVRYIVAGGIAVNLYGVPRMTYDIDLLLDLEDANVERFLRLVKGWGFRPNIPADIMDFAKKETREEWINNRNMKAFCLVNPEWAISEIDVVIDAPVDYNKVSKNINHVVLQGVSVPLISKDDLIRMKQKTGRKQDEADIKYLKEAGYEKGKKPRV